MTQSSAILVFGGFASGYTQRWGPIVGIYADLPPGGWFPATARSDDRLTMNFSDGTHRYIQIMNIDVDHPRAYVSGDATGFIADTEVLIRIRHANSEETKAIRDDPRRKDLLRILPKLD